MNYNINEQGRSMIEMLGVLAIVGVLSVGGIAGYSKAMNKFKVNKTIDQVNMIATNIRTLFASQKDYADVDNRRALKKAGAIPAEMYTNVSDGKITNAFGGEVYIGSTSQLGDRTVDDSFMIIINQIPQSACVAIATTDWGADSAGLIAMRIMGNTKQSSGGNDMGVFSRQPVTASISLSGTKSVDNLPFSIVDASTLCSNGNNLNSIAWKYF